MSCIREDDLIKRMDELGITRRDICNYSGLTYATLSSYLNGYTKMPVTCRIKIDEYLNQNAIEK